MAAVERMRAADFTGIFFTSHENICNVDHNKEHIKTIFIPQLRSIEDYSKFVITRLPAYLHAFSRIGMVRTVLVMVDLACVRKNLWMHL